MFWPFRTARILKPLCILLAFALVAAACPQPEAPPAEPEVLPEPEEVELNFVVWSYGVETIQDNIRLFQEANPGVRVNLSDFSWFDYHDIMAARFTAGTPTEVAYSSDHWLEEWVAAGWIVPIDEHCPGTRDYIPEFAPYAVQGMTLDGKLYGLPYYADMLVFMYNAAAAAEAGITGAPQTWEELTEHALQIKEAGIADRPINIPLKKDDPWTIEIFYSMVYSMGGSMFDEDHNPVFNEPGSEAEQVLQWLYDAIHTWEVMDPAALEVAEPDVVSTMGAGHHIYTVLAKYNLAELNLGLHDHAGNFELALMPGETHSTVGFVRFYSMGRDTPNGGPHVVDAACRFLHYFGGETDGEYKVVKRWALEFGLGFAQLPLYDDPEVADAINQWGDVDLELEQARLARVKEGLTPWWGIWDVFAREQIHDAVLGVVSPQEALQNMANRWEDLRSEFE